MPDKFWRLFNVCSWMPFCENARKKSVITDWKPIVLKVWFYFSLKIKAIIEKKHKRKTKTKTKTNKQKLGF